MLRTYNTNIYAIVRMDGSEELSFRSFPVSINWEPSEAKLKEYHRYAVSLFEQYSDCLIYLNSTYKMSSYERELRREAIAFNHTIDEVRRKNDVVAYSHRYGGWVTIDWRYNDDIRFSVDTNFGYGSNSYMSVRFYYKNLQLTPYSNYIHYRFANFTDIIRYTYEYNLVYSSWQELLKDTLLFYNAVVKNKEHEVFNWLKNHLNNLVNGLGNLRKTTLSFSIYSSNRDRMDNITGDELVRLKIEKIIGSYEFIGNIQQLPVEVSPSDYVARIQQNLNDFKPQLIEYRTIYQKKYEELEAKTNNISIIPDIKIYDRLLVFHGKIYSWDSKKAEKLRVLLRVRNYIAPEITITELKKRYEKIKSYLELREDLLSRKSMVLSIIYQINNAIDTIANTSK